MIWAPPTALPRVLASYPPLRTFRSAASFPRVRLSSLLPRLFSLLRRGSVSHPRAAFCRAPPSLVLCTWLLDRSAVLSLPLLAASCPSTPLPLPCCSLAFLVFPFLPDLFSFGCFLLSCLSLYLLATCLLLSSSRCLPCRRLLLDPGLAAVLFFPLSSFSDPPLHRPFFSPFVRIGVAGGFLSRRYTIRYLCLATRLVGSASPCLTAAVYSSPFLLPVTVWLLHPCCHSLPPSVASFLAFRLVPSPLAGCNFPASSEFSLLAARLPSRRPFLRLAVFPLPRFRSAAPPFVGAEATASFSSKRRSRAPVSLHILVAPSSRFWLFSSLSYFRLHPFWRTVIPS